MTSPPSVRVVLVDDHPIWRDAVERDLVGAGLLVVGAFADAEGAIRATPALRPDVIVMDLQLPALSGVEAVHALVAMDPSLRILMLSSSGEQGDVLAAVKAGARGYLVKSARSRELVAAVRGTAAGEATYSPGLAALVLEEFQRAGRVTSSGEPGPSLAITERETEILRLVAKGLTARLIAERLVVSHRTVQNHIQSTLRKLQLHNKVELTRWAIEQGLTD